MRAVRQRGPRSANEGIGSSPSRIVVNGVLGVVCAFLLASCALIANSPGGNEGEDAELLRSGFTTQSGECSPCPCLKVNVAGPGDLPVGATGAARREIQRQLIDGLLVPLETTEVDAGKDEELSTAQKRERFSTQLEGAFLQVQKDGVTSAPIDWRIERGASLLYSNDRIATYEVINRGYLGGAHGFDDRKILTFDLASGKRLALTDIVEEGSRAAFEKIVEREFRRVRQIPPDTSLIDEGVFLSESGGLALTDNVGIVAAGLVLHYNPYEVAPYSYGPTQVIVPREALVGVGSQSAVDLMH